MDSETIIVLLGRSLFLFGVPLFLNSFSRLVQIDKDSFSLRRLVWGTVSYKWDQVQFAHSTKMTSALLRLEIGRQSFLDINTSYFVILSWNSALGDELLSQLRNRGLMKDHLW